jgi:lambda family phage portal protein
VSGVLYDHLGRPLRSEMSAEFTGEYEAASMGARLGTWGLSGAGPTAASRSLGTLRARSREAVRNNPLARGGVNSYVSNLVGTDISPRWLLDNEEQKAELQELWIDSHEELDFYGVSNFYGLEEVACRAMIQDGEVLGRLVATPPDMGLLVPMQVQLLESDHLDHNYNDIAPNGNEIRYGIEWQAGRRVAYWIDSEHPGEQFLTSSGSHKVRIPAEDMVHVFRPERPGQARASSWLATVLLKLHDIDQYDDAELVRKKAAALWGGFIYSENPVQAGHLGASAKTTSAGQQVIELKAGTFPVLKPGQKISFHTTADVGSTVPIYLKTQFRLIARGLGITYEQLTGDLEGVTYSSIRAGLIEFRRLCETIQARTVIFQFCRPIIRRWVATAVLAGATRTISVRDYLADPRRYLRVEWHPDGWEYTDPVKDVMGDILEVRAGFTTRSAKAAKRGHDAERVDRINADDSSRARAAGLVYDSDPAQTTKSGTVQRAENAVIDESFSE